MEVPTISRPYGYLNDHFADLYKYLGNIEDNEGQVQGNVIDLSYEDDKGKYKGMLIRPYDILHL
jgi:hypothetical protein